MMGAPRTAAHTLSMLGVSRQSSPMPTLRHPGRRSQQKKSWARTRAHPLRRRTGRAQVTPRAPRASPRRRWRRRRRRRLRSPRSRTARSAASSTGRAPASRSRAPSAPPHGSRRRAFRLSSPSSPAAPPAAASVGMSSLSRWTPPRGSSGERRPRSPFRWTAPPSSARGRSGSTTRCGASATSAPPSSRTRPPRGAAPARMAASSLRGPRCRTAPSRTPGRWGSATRCGGGATSAPWSAQRPRRRSPGRPPWRGGASPSARPRGPNAPGWTPRRRPRRARRTKRSFTPRRRPRTSAGCPPTPWRIATRPSRRWRNTCRCAYPTPGRRRTQRTFGRCGRSFKRATPTATAAST
mmetsp:Transcript_98838/g.279704  ORF Transcript_98838/g.279704 Transcript_98838/m.279704 type:complete len:352 (-) Transcript_98838:598-1653(-)